MRKLFLLIVLSIMTTIQAKTTYIPTYRSYLHIVTGGDTLAVMNNLDTLELADPEGIFMMRIDHEDVTKEKVKAIKRKKRLTGWMTFAAVMSGISTAFSDNSLQYMLRSTNTQFAATLAGIYADNAKAEQTLEITAWINNTSDYELMVCDMERGLTWWILPRQTMELRLNNPEASILRISDAKNDHVRYATIVAGSKVTKWEIDLETEDYWYSPVYHPDKPHKPETIVYYIRISKRDYLDEKITVLDFKNIKESTKNKKQ